MRGVAQTAPVWRHTTEENISFLRLAPTGHLLVGTRDRVVSLNPEAGDVRWARTDLGGLSEEAFNPIRATPYAVVRTKDGIALLDVGSGETMWDSTAIPLEKVRGYLLLRRHGMVLVYGEAAESRRTFVAVEIGTGAVKWRQDTLLRRNPPLASRSGIRSFSGHQPPIFDSDTSFILNLSKDGPLRIHARTGELLWRLDSDENPPLLTQRYARMVYDAGVLFVPYDRTVLAVNTDDGTIVWDREEDFRSRLTQMQLTAAGLVVRGRRPPDLDDEALQGTEFFIDLLDPGTGYSLWHEPFTSVIHDIPFLAEPDAIFVTRERDVVALDYFDGSAVEIGAFELEGGGVPTRVELSGPNLHIASRQDFVSLTRAGLLRYHRYYEAPGASVLEEIATFVALVVIENAFCDQEVEDPDCYGSEDEVSFGDAWDEMAEWRDTFLLRQAATVEAANYAYVYTKAPDATGRRGFSLVKLDKRSGEEAGRVWIDERRPEYVIDPVAGIVFVKEDDKVIYAARFPAR
jgi:hypothetical protein